MEVVASLSQGRTAAAQCSLFTHKSVPVIFEPPCTYTSVIQEILTFSTFLFFYTIKTAHKICFMRYCLELIL